METVLIAGGTGNIGRKLTQLLEENGYKVLVLTRKPVKKNHFYWNPYKDLIDEHLPFNEIHYLINLTGEGIGDKSWSKKRRHDIRMSRLVPAQFLVRLQDKFSNLKHVLQISGATCYGQNKLVPCKEEDAFGTDFLSQVVHDWENSADFFTSKQFTTLRCGVVFYEGGALKKIIMPIKFYLGCNMGNGEQYIPWVSMDDVCHAFLFCIKNNVGGTFNLVAGNIQQKTLNLQAATYFKTKMWLPNIPKGFWRLVLGEMSELLTESYPVDNNKILKTGFKFTETSFNAVLLKYFS